MSDSLYRTAARILCGIVLAIGLLVLLGWLMHWPALVRFHDTWASMKPNTAIGLMLAALALFFKLKPGRTVIDENMATVLASLVCLIGLLNWMEHVFGLRLGINGLFLRDDLTPPPGIPGQLSVATAKSFVFLGFGLIAFDWKTRERSLYLGQGAAGIVFLFAMVSITGYVYDVSGLYQWRSFETTAIHTSLSLLLLSVAMLLSRPRLGLMSFLTSVGPGSAMARRVVLPAVLLPFAIGWIRVSAERAGLFSIRFGSGLAMLCSMLGLVGLILWNAKALDRADASRTDAEASLRQKEKELFQASKLEAVGRLAGGVAHDFNNILTGIIGLVEEVESETSEPSHREILRSVIQSADRAARLTKQLLGFSRQQVAAPVVLDLNDVVRSLRPLLSRSLGPDIELVDSLSPEPAFVDADPIQLEQILLNLSLNAKDAMPTGGCLTFNTALETIEGTEMVVWEISDTGQGMTPETLKNIFEPFFTTKEIGRGTGLGLATVYGIIKQNKGDVTVDSHVGRGTTFRIVWPSTRARPSLAPTKALDISREEKNETILVVDDEALVLRFVTGALRKAGYSVLSATNAAEALSLSQDLTVPISLLLTDVVMPTMNGASLSEHLRATRPELRVLFMSGYSEKVIVDRGILKPGIHFIEKAFTAEKLREKVHAALH